MPRLSGGEKSYGNTTPNIVNYFHYYHAKG
jgi:hypothetical protein